MSIAVIDVGAQFIKIGKLTYECGNSHKRVAFKILARRRNL
jgi:hypothetical protein